jgi:hypothetical protein
MERVRSTTKEKKLSWSLQYENQLTAQRTSDAEKSFQRPLGPSTMKDTIKKVQAVTPTFPLLPTLKLLTRKTQNRAKFGIHLSDAVRNRGAHSHPTFQSQKKAAP